MLDAGCGRGEWLELLKEQGITTGRGIDNNRVMVKQCEGYGLDVIEGDVIESLRDFPSASLGAVTAFHLIEHLPLNVLVKFLDETARVLKSGGIAIFETPNPENILVGAFTFYLDPDSSSSSARSDDEVSCRGKGVVWGGNHISSSLR